MKKLPLTLSSALCAGSLLASTTSVWSQAVNNQWQEPGNWSAGVPNDIDVVASLTGVAASGATNAIESTSDVTVGGITAANTSYSLSGSNITFAVSGTTTRPEIFVDDGIGVTMENGLEGTQGLVKNGTGDLTVKMDKFLYTGPTEVCGGTLTVHRPADDRTADEYKVGDSIYIGPGAMLFLDGWNILDNKVPVTVDGGIFKLNYEGFDYIDRLTLCNGGRVCYGGILVYDGVSGHIDVNGFGQSSIENNLAIATPDGSYGKGIYCRTQVVEVAASASLLVSGIFHNSTKPEDKAYRGALRKRGPGDMIFSRDRNDYQGPTVIEEGRLVLSNNAEIASSVVSSEGGSLFLAAGSTARVGGLDIPADQTWDLNNQSLYLGGSYDSSNVKGTLRNGTIEKVGNNTFTVWNSAVFDNVNLKITDGTIALKESVAGSTSGGTVSRTPLLRFTFDNPGNLAENTGSLGLVLGALFGSGAAPQYEESGLHGGSVRFSGATCFSLASPQGLPNGAAPFTISAWVAPETAESGLISWGNNATGQSGGIGIQQGGPNFFFYGRGDLKATPDASYYNGNWYHLAAVYDPSLSAGQMKIYKDGVQVAAGNPNGSIGLVQANLYVGCVIGQAGRLFKGLMDDLELYDCALSADEIAEMTTSGVEKTVINHFDPAYPIEMGDEGVLEVGTKAQAFSALSGGGGTLKSKQGSTITLAQTGDVTLTAFDGTGDIVKDGANAVMLKRGDFSFGNTSVTGGSLTLDSVEPHLVAYYKFDDAANPGKDSSGHGFHLVSTTGDIANHIKTDMPGCVYFDGSNGLTFDSAIASAAYAALPAGNSAFTVCFAFNPDGNCSKTGGFYSWGEQAEQQMNAMRFNEKYNQLNIYNWGNDWFQDTSDLAAGDDPSGWHYVAISYDPVTQKRHLYVDGNSSYVNNVAKPMNVKTTNFSIGRSQGYQKYEYMRGYFDSFAIFDTVLSPAEIKSLLQNKTYPFKSPGAPKYMVAAGASVTVNGWSSMKKITSEGGVSIGPKGVLTLMTTNVSSIASLAGSGKLSLTDRSVASIADSTQFTGTIEVKGGVLAYNGHSVEAGGFDFVNGAIALNALTAATPIVKVSGTATLAAPVVTVPDRVTKPFSVPLIQAKDFAGDLAWTLNASVPDGWKTRFELRGDTYWLSVAPIETVVIIR